MSEATADVCREGHPILADNYCEHGHIRPVRDFAVSEQPIPGMDEHTCLMRRIKKCLHRWSARYAESAHAKFHVAETRLLEQEIDEWLLKQ